METETKHHATGPERERARAFAEALPGGTVGKPLHSRRTRAKDRVGEEKATPGKEASQ